MCQNHIHTHEHGPAHTHSEADHHHSPAEHRRLWNAEAQRYNQTPTASFATDPFLQIVEKSGALTDQARVLDLGCGPGIYSVALAERAKEVLGLDISEEMLVFARERAREAGRANCTFAVVNWAEADAQALGLTRSFDVALARLTPAIHSDSHMDKLVACATRVVFYENFVNRRHRWMNLAFEIAGPTAGKPWHDDMVYELIEHLKTLGKETVLYSRPVQWGQEKKPWDQVADFCLRRLALRIDVTDDITRAVREEFRRRSQDGFLDTREDLTLLTAESRLI